MGEHQTGHSDRHEPIDLDRLLAEAVKEALLRGTESAGLDIHVSSVDGTVRLWGIVDVLAQKTAAESIARRVPGVRGINNDITVATEGVEDKELAEVLTEKLTRIPELRDVGCRVEKGRVALVGHVKTTGDAMRAVQVAEGTMAVAGVVSHIKIGEGEKEDDAAISRYALRLLDQMGLDHGQFQVYTDAGVLFIKGFVRDDAERQRVVRMMRRLEGVQRVDATLVTDDETGGVIH
jgi:hyperosmotically inducible periplasmic protein